MVKKFKLWRFVCGRFLQRGDLDFGWDLVLPDISNGSKLKYCAYSGLEVDSSEKKNQTSKNKNNAQVEVNKHSQKKDG